MKKKLYKMRLDSGLTIAGYAGGNILFAAAPKPTAEVPSHIVLTAADFVMCAQIYSTYFGEEISEISILEILGDAGLLVAVVGGAGYALAKTATGFVAEAANFFGPLGWAASGILAAGSTAILGFAWLGFIDWAYRNKVEVMRNGGEPKFQYDK